MPCDWTGLESGHETTQILREMGSPVILAPLGITAKTGKQANCRSTDEWIQTIGSMYTMEYFSTRKK